MVICWAVLVNPHYTPPLRTMKVNTSVGEVIGFIHQTEKTHDVTLWGDEYVRRVVAVDHSIRAQLSLRPEDPLPEKALIHGLALNAFNLLRGYVRLRELAESSALPLAA